MLPKIDTPVYKVKLPSNGKELDFRPFKVKEQKALLIAMESPEDGAVEATTLSIVQACLFDKVDAKKLPKIDIDYIFIKLREKSIGEQIDLIVTCGECNHQQDYIFDLKNVEIKQYDGYSTNIKLSDNMGLIMRLPSFEEVSNLNKDYTVENIYKTVVSCIEQIYDGDAVYLTKDKTFAEVEEWVDDLTQDQYDKLEMFYKTTPSLISTIEFTCQKCQHNNKIKLEGIEDFFE